MAGIFQHLESDGLDHRGVVDRAQIDIQILCRCVRLTVAHGKGKLSDTIGIGCGAEHDFMAHRIEPYAVTGIDCT